MARVSFQLRRLTADTEKGSYARYDSAQSFKSYGAGGASVTVPTRVDYDSALRADGLQIAPTTAGSFFFEATSSCYGEMSLAWSADITEVPTASPLVTGIVMVYSTTGEPQTIASGTILVESSNTFSYEHTGIPEGQWAYYSLFVHYTSTGGDDYYERAASLSVIVPKNYQSNLALWNRIPEFYRTQDTLIGDMNYSTCLGNVQAGTPVGPLFKLVSVIGFDMDRIRTIIDYLMVSKDPNLANTETLDAIGEQMSVILTSNDLGGQRLRSVLQDIGYFRRSKGTLAGTEFFAKAISGSNISVDTLTGSIIVYSQRVNYVTVPKTGTGIVQHRAAFDNEVTVQRPFVIPGSYLNTTAVAASYASAPDSAALDVVGDIELVAKVALVDWTPSASSAIVSKRATSNHSYSLSVTSAGLLLFEWSVAGTTILSSQSTVAPTVVDEAILWVKATMDVDNGASGNTVTFYTATDQAAEPSSWTQLGAVVTTAGVTSLFSGTAPLEMGGYASGSVNALKGKIYRVVVRNGIAGTVVFDANFEKDITSTGQTTIVEDSSNLATVTRSGSATFFVGGQYGTYTTSGSSFTTTGAGAGASASMALLHINPPLPVQPGLDRGVFSVNSGVGTSAIKWVRLVDAAGIILGSSNAPILVDGVPHYEIPTSSRLTPTIIEGVTSNGANADGVATFVTPPLENDVIFMWVASTTSAALNSVAGWVNVLGGTTDVETTSPHEQACVYHIVTKAEAVALTTTFTATGIYTTSQNHGTVSINVRNVDVNTPLAGVASTFSNTTGVTHVIAGVTPTVTNGLVVAAVASDESNGINNYTTPAGWTSRAYNSTFLGHELFSYNTPTNAGFAVPATNVTGSIGAGEEYTSITVVLNPAKNTSSAWVNTFVEVLVDLSAVATFNFANLLSERNYFGTYFDGDTKRGGWLLGTPTVSDYRWAGSANSSVSIFAEDYERTKAVVNELLFAQLPITEESKYSITAFNAVPGF